jgi:hypothetical protein
MYLLLLLCVWNCATAQVILIKPNLGDCLKCALKMGQDFNSKQTGIPTYLVFSSSAIADSAEIEQSLQYKEKGMHLAFSDKLLQYFKNDNNVAYINAAGQVLVQKKLFLVVDSDIKAMRDDYEENFRFYCSPSKVYKFSDENLLAVDGQMNSATLFTGKDTFTLKVTDALYNKIRRSVKAFYPGLFDETERYLAEKPEDKFLLKPSIGNYTLHGDNAYLTVRVAYLDSVNSETLDLRKVNVLLRFHRDSCYIYNIFIPYLVDRQYFPKDRKIPDRLPNTFYGRTCTIKNDSTIIFTIADSKNPKPGQLNHFLAEFKIRNGVVEYDRQLNIDLPEVYKQSNIAYPDPYTYTSQYRIDYPYFTTAIYPSLIDLSAEKSYDYTVPFTVKVPDSAKLELETSPLQNYYIYKDLKRSNAYILCRINGRMSLQVLSLVKNVALMKIIDLKEFGILNQPTDFFQIIPAKNIVYAADGNGYVRTYPLELLLGG